MVSDSSSEMVTFFLFSFFISCQAKTQVDGVGLKVLRYWADVLGSKIYIQFGL